MLDEEDIRGRCAYSPHYYDGLTLVTRHWNWFNADALGLIRGKYWSVLQAIKIGESMIRQSLQEQLGMLKRDAETISSGDRKSTRLNSSHVSQSRMPSSA